ncbi:hypothetical protein Ahy_A07g035497 isoform B [Arachis hypogaea]|nr:hypothetical protein Ahy_A07g035497 isoform B [Arachis hypogaea]
MFIKITQILISKLKPTNPNHNSLCYPSAATPLPHPRSTHPRRERREERRRDKLSGRRRRPWSCEELRCCRAPEERKRDQEERGQGEKEARDGEGGATCPLHLVVVGVGAAAGCAVAVELGTRYSSSIFLNRAPPGQLLLLNFIGGATNPGMLSKMDSELIQVADRDLRKILINPNANNPTVLGVKLWPKAVPQFLIGHVELLNVAKAALKDTGFAGMFLGENYVSGVALGACVEGAYELAAKVNDVASNGSTLCRRREERDGQRGEGVFREEKEALPAPPFIPVISRARSRCVFK